MARDRDGTTPKESVAPRNPARRSLIAVGVPALGSLGFAGSLLRSRQAVAEAAAGDATSSKEVDASVLTPHRDAYYRRARF